MDVLAWAICVLAVVVAIAAVLVIDDLISAVFEFIADNALIILVIGFVIFGGATLVFWLTSG